jgi:CRP-like cAMP-binding protein
MLEIFAHFEKEHPESVEIKNFGRNEIVLSTGQVERYTYLVLKGAVRVVLNKDGKEQNIRFGYPGSIITSIPSFFDDSPSRFDMLALRKTQLKRFEKKALLLFLKSSPEKTQAYIETLYDLVNQLVEREIDLLTYSPAERFEIVMQRSPQLFQHVPAQHIANYLRMSAEHLSRLRNS